MKTLATFRKAEEAHLVRMRLEDAGIPAYLRDEYITQLGGAWMFPGEHGGVKLEVDDEDYDAAKAFLAEEAGEP